MINSDLIKIVQESQLTAKVVLDLVFLLIAFLLLWLLFGWNKVVFTTLFVFLVIIFSVEEMLTNQAITVKQVEEGLDGVTAMREVTVRNDQRSPFQPSCFKRIARYLPLVLSGAVQVINAAKGDYKYKLTKRLSGALTTNSVPHITYRSYLKGPLPPKTIFVCQHISYFLETLLYSAFVPDSHQSIVLNHFGMHGDVEFLLHHLVAKNLYGGMLLEIHNKPILRKQLNALSKRLIANPSPEVLCIWASGKPWEPKHPNGCREFRSGAFSFSLFANAPICIVHGRLSTDSRRLIIEQSDLIYPPVSDVTRAEGIDYMSFSNNPVNKNIIDEYRRRVELQYRRIDDGLAKEVETRT
jgi:hypothetical protein